MKRPATRSMRTWRKIHRWTFGYWRWVGLVSVIVMVIISVSGILLVHQDDFRFMQRSRVPLGPLPGHYAERIAETRVEQGTAEILPAEASVPLRWVVLDLHTGEFFGKLGPLYYDIIAVMFTVLASTGIVMFFKIYKSKPGQGV